MKNLKKILALVLAFACAFTMFAGAAFTDQADINADNADAVELLTTLNIISGYPDGTFDPEGTVDRAEMAKMIYTIRNGGNDDASAHVDNTTSFTDINGHWAEGYIKYLQNTGIVAGKSATTFDPDSPVTTTEAMKMALALAGYDEKNAELTGPNWSKNTLTLATTIGLTDDVNSAMTAGCTRQDAAQILANVLEATAVRYSAIVENFVNDSKTGLSYGGDPITVGYKWMDLSVYVGRMVSSGELAINYEDNGRADAAGKDRFSIVVETVNGVSWNRWDWTGYRGDLAWDENDRTLTVKDGQDHTDLVGMEVKLLAGDKIDEVYGVYATGTSNVVETTMDQIDVTSDNKIKIDDVTYDTKKADVYVDLGLDSNGDPLTIDTFGEVFGDEGRVAADTVKAIDWDDDGDYETVLVNTVTVARVNSVNSSAITVGETGSRDESIFGNTHSIEFDGNDIYEDVAKNDYVAITKDRYDDSWNVAKVESVDGVVNGLVDDKYQIRVGGEWYALANDGYGKNHGGILYTVDGSRDVFTNGDEITMYAIGTTVYYADSARGNDANRSVLMVYDVQKKEGIWAKQDKVKAIFADGEKKTITLDLDAEGADVTQLRANDANGYVDIGRMYYYEVNNDGEYALYAVGADTLVGYDQYTTSNGLVKSDKISGYTIADDAVVFALIGDNDAAVYTGKTVKDADEDLWKTITNGGVLIDEDNRINYARMLNVATNKELDDTTNYAYLLTNAVRSLNDKQYIEYTMWTDEGELVEALEETDVHRENYLLAGDVITYAEDGQNADGVQMIKNVSELSQNGDDVMFAAIMGCSGDDLRVLTDLEDTVFQVNSDTKAIYVDTDRASMEQGMEDQGDYDYPATRVSATDNTEYYINALYQLDNDGSTIKFILIDLAGELNGDTVNAREKNYTELTNPTLETLQSELRNYRTVTVKGDFTLAAGKELNVPNGVSLTFANELNLLGEINGDVTVDTIKGASNGTINGTLTITGDTADNSLDSLKGSNGSEIVLNDAYKSAANFYANSSKITDVLKGTYTWADSNDAGNAGWNTGKLDSKTITFSSSVTEIEDALKQSDNVTVNGDVDLDKALTVKDGQTVTFNGTVDTETFKLTINEGATVNFANLTISASGRVEINGTANVSGTLTTADGESIQGTGVLNVSAAQTAENICRVDGSGLILRMAQETSNKVTAGRWNIGGYTGTAVQAPAGAYISDDDDWVLTSDVEKINVSADITNADLQKLFSKTGNVIISSTAPTADILVPAGKTLTLTIAPSAQILVKGALVLNGTGLDLTKITGESGATVSFGAAATVDSSKYGDFYTAGGNKITMDLQLQGNVFTYGPIPNSMPTGNGFVWSGSTL